MSYSTPPRKQKPSVNVPQRRCDAVDKNPFTIDEIADLCNEYIGTDGILFGSAAVWIYAKYCDFTSEELEMLNLTGVGSDVDILVKDTLTDDDFSRITDPEKCRQIDIVDVAKIYQSENHNFKRKNVMENIRTSIIVGNRYIPIITPDALKKIYIRRRDNEENTKRQIDKIQRKIDILEDVMDIMSTRPETDVAFASTQFKF
jgi:hypothetical protein